MKSGMGSHPFNGVKTPPAAVDASMRLPKGPSVNESPTRSGTAKTPKTLGPRVA